VRRVGAGRRTRARLTARRTAPPAPAAAAAPPPPPPAADLLEDSRRRELAQVSGAYRLAGKTIFPADDQMVGVRLETFFDGARRAGSVPEADRPASGQAGTTRAST
jgi:hypothetical protein